MFVRLLVCSVLLVPGAALAQAAPSSQPGAQPTAQPAEAPAVQKVSTAAATPAAMTPQQRLEAGRKKALELAAGGQCDEAKELAMRIGEAALTTQVEKACAR